MAFGDSITRGVGDFIAPGQEIEMAFIPTSEAGYPLRLEPLLGVNVQNQGDPGESIHTFGLPRFVSVMQQLRPDIVIVLEGSNDSFAFITPDIFFHNYQVFVNVAKSLGIEIVVSTLVPTCCNHSGIRPFVNSYLEQIRRIAAVNAVPLADIAHAFANTCNLNECRLLNLPEGLHPNTDGYDIIGEVQLATLLNIDLFAPDGPALLEQAVNLPAGSVKTVPDAAPPASGG